MSVDLRTALRYPYLEGNRLQGWIIPSTVILLLQVLSLVTLFGLQQAIPDLPPESVSLMILPFTLTMNLLLAGFLWHMAGTVQAQGTEATLPSWWANLKTYFIDGLKLLPYLILVNLLLIGINNLPILPEVGETTDINQQLLALGLVALLTIVLLPLFSTPIVQSAQTYGLKELFQPTRAAGILRHHYVSGLGAAALSILVFALYGGIVYLLMTTSWGVMFIPFASVPMIVTIWHLMTQALSPQTAN